jgi:hypothetical protein
MKKVVSQLDSWEEQYGKREKESTYGHFHTLSGDEF